MRVLVSCSLGGAGHLNPLRPVVDSLRESGDEVLVVVPPSMQARAAKCGCPVRVGAEPPADRVAEIRNAIATLPRAAATVLAERELFARLGTAAMLPEMEAAFADWRPQLALRETCEYAAAVVATRRGVPHAQVAISRSESEAGALLTAAPVLEDYERGVVERIRRSPYLTRFPASVDPDSFPDTRRFSEPRRPEVARLPSFWAGETLPLAYLSFGSVTGSLAMAGEVYRLALEAVKDLPMRVLLTVGNRIDVTELGPVPENVHVERWVPQEQVFPEASLVICHGGSGTTFGALAAGLPLVIVPLFADQSSNGHRVADAGAGVVVAAGDEKRSSRPFGHLDAARVAAAIKTVLNDPGYARAAARIARELAALPPVGELLAALRAELAPITPQQPNDLPNRH